MALPDGRIGADPFPLDEPSNRHDVGTWNNRRKELNIVGEGVNKGVTSIESNRNFLGAVGEVTNDGINSKAFGDVDDRAGGVGKVTVTKEVSKGIGVVGGSSRVEFGVQLSPFEAAEILLDYGKGIVHPKIGIKM